MHIGKFFIIDGMNLWQSCNCFVVIYPLIVCTMFCDGLSLIWQGCGLVLNVSVSRRYRDAPTCRLGLVSLQYFANALPVGGAGSTDSTTPLNPSRSRLDNKKLQRLDLVSVSVICVSCPRRYFAQINLNKGTEYCTDLLSSSEQGVYAWSRLHAIAPYNLILCIIIVIINGRENKVTTAGWLPVHRDRFQAQLSVTSMGSLHLFIPRRSRYRLRRGCGVRIQQ